MKYKDLQNKIHDDMDGTATHLLPAGRVLITDAEATAILNPPQSADELKARHNAFILARLAAADLTIIRSLVEGDTARINIHKNAQALLRVTLIV